MKNIKKIVALLLAVVLTVALAACGGSGAGKDDTPVLTMATSPDFPPYEYKDGNKVVGIDAEVAQAIADKLGMKLEIVSIDFDSIIAGVTAGKFDMGMSGLTITEERKASVDFSDPYANAVQAVIVREDSGINSIDDLYNVAADGTKTVKDDTMIGVQTSTTGDIYASDDVENDGFGGDHVTKYKTGADAVQALSSGKVNAVIIDNEPAKSFVAANQGLKILEAPYVEEQYAIAFNKSNTELNQKINAALKELIADGTVQKIIDSYIK